MTRMVREFVDIREHTSLEDVISALEEIRDREGIADAELRMRGDHIFGRMMTISYLRPQTAEEKACDARYADIADCEELMAAA